jgi:hypothetical protein
MFFFGIFGVDYKEKEVKIIKNIICKACGQLSSYVLLTTYNYFHFFFIPIFKWNKRYYLKDRCCSSVFEISEETFDKINEKESVEINDNELKEVKNSSYNEVIICKNCGRRADSHFEYCPYCGSKL